MIVADLDLSLIDRESMALDVTGHHAWPDVFLFPFSGRTPLEIGRAGSLRGSSHSRAKVPSSTYGYRQEGHCRRM
jgi:hypothetical protein